MTQRVTDQMPSGAIPKFSSEREWLDHLRILAELPYPSLALMSSLLPVMRCGVASSLGGFAWTDSNLNPLAFMTERMNERAYRWWIGNRNVVLDMFPVRRQLESRGNMVREKCLEPGFEESAFCREILASQGLRWMALATVGIAGGKGYGFLSVYRAAAFGPFSDAEQTCLTRGVEALSALGQAGSSPLASLPPCELREAEETSLMIQEDGTMVARSQEAMRLVYLLGGANMYTLEWARPDWLVLPEPVRETIQALFQCFEPEAKRRIRIDRPWGRFDFVLEKMQDRRTPGKPLVMIGIRYYEPIDITVARRLAGWPMRPSEKRIVIASTRSTNLSELAAALGITVNTLKSYNKEMVDRMAIESRQALINRLLSDEVADGDVRNFMMQRC